MKVSASEIRGGLKAKGVTFVVCYLDENSSDDKCAIITHARSRDIYTFFLMNLLEDPSLGVIFKPAYIHDFKERVMDPLKDLFDKAQATGRLKVMGEGHFKTDALPAEAASAADITIGLLLSGTATLEAVLTGGKAVFLDLEGLGYKDIYRWGKGSVVFDSCPSLWEALCRFRKDPAGFPQFGDLHHWIKDSESYQGHQGAERIAKHIDGLCAVYRKEIYAG